MTKGKSEVEQTPVQPGIVFPVFNEIDWLLTITMLFVIGMPLMTNFFGWDQKLLFDQRQWMLSWYYAVCVALGVVAMVRYGIGRLATDRYSIFLIAGILSFFLSLLLGALNGSKISPMCVMAPFFTVLMFHVFIRKKISSNFNFAKWALVVYLLAPLIVFFFPFLFKLPFELYASESFRGFSYSRTDYGYLAGIAILILLIKPALSNLVFLPALFLALLLSENRTAVLSIMVAIGYLLLMLNNKRLTALGLIIFCLAIVYFGSDYSIRKIAFFYDSGHRLDILMASIEKAYDGFLFGSGMFYQSIYVSTIDSLAEPHNSILQSILNFGVIPTIFWYLIVARAYFSMNAQGRPFLLYWFVFGLFHPGYDAFLFTPESLISLLLALHFGSRSNASIIHPLFPTGARLPGLSRVPA